MLQKQDRLQHCFLLQGPIQTLVIQSPSSVRVNQEWEDSSVIDVNQDFGGFQKYLKGIKDASVSIVTAHLLSPNYCVEVSNVTSY
jgi:hypothetical protein